MKLTQIEFFKNLNKHPIKHGILPNPSCDLDSIACSMGLSYFLYIKKNLICHPLLPQNIKLNHRFEVKYILEKYFTDITQVFQIIPKEIDTISLVDHNHLAYDIKHKQVMYILDHHQNTNSLESEFELIETVGSCATLILQLFKENSIHLEDSLIRQLLVSAVVIDTCNFNTSLTGRWQEKDKILTNEIIPEGLFGELSKLKYDVKNNLSLTNQEIYEKDMKIFNYSFGQVNYMTVFLNWGLLDQRDFKKTIIVNNKDFSIVLTIADGIQIKKEAIVFGTQILSKWCQFEKDEGQEMGWSYGQCFDNSISRKIIEPLISQIQIEI